MTTSSTDSFALEPFLARERRRVGEALVAAIEGLRPLLPGEVGRAVQHGVTTGGKRLRPILCLAAYEACGGRDPDRALEVAVAVELIHAYSLMHDDLPCMDDAALRRGHPTPHTVYGEPAVVVGAAALIPAAHLHLWRSARSLGLGDTRVREMVVVLARAAGGGGMVGGQALDLLAEGRTLDAEELDRLHGMKTGALLTASLRIGGLAAGASASQLEGLEAFGAAVGLAFQIADDVLDATADADALGKAPSDAELNKSTYVSRLGVDGARKEATRLADRGCRALAEAALEAPALEALAKYAVSRRR